MSLPAEFLQHWVDVKACRISASLDTILDVKTRRISVRLSRQTLNNFCKIGYHTLQNFCKEWNWKKKRLTILISFFRWIIQNVSLLKKHIFLIRENWSILLLQLLRNFRVLCLNIAALKPTFYCVWKKSTIFCGIDKKNIPKKRSIFHGKCYFGKQKIVGKRFYRFVYLSSKFHFEFRISNFFSLVHKLLNCSFEKYA